MDTMDVIADPILYDPSFEVMEEGEQKTTQELGETLQKISETTFKDSGHASRSVHLKSHGILRAEMQVASGLPPVLAQGIFAKAATYPVVMRLSTSPGDDLPDSVSTPRGMAIKIVGVEGERLQGSEGDVTQDFVMVNGPAFLVPGPKKFLGNLKLLAATTDKVPTIKRALSSALQGTERLIEAAGGESATLKSLGGHPETHILGETFFSQVPMLYGPYIAKISLVPVSPQLTQLKDRKVDLKDRPNGLREAVVDFFSEHDAVWELRVQLCTDIEAMPIEDATVPWPEEASPYLTVATIRAARQPAWNEALHLAVDDRMSFSPWHGIAAHRPLGAIMRVRKHAYAVSAKFRALRNGVDLGEPRSLDDFPV